MKLTKLQRYTAYCIMLETAENPFIAENPFLEGDFRGTDENGLCWMWKLIFGNHDLYYSPETLLPELYKKQLGGFWINAFHTWEQRIAALKQCIAETEPQ